MSSCLVTGQPVHWRLVLVVLLAIGGMALLITGSWMLSEGLNGAVVDHNNPYIHFSETTATQEVNYGTALLIVGVACLVALALLLLLKRTHSKRG